MFDEYKKIASDLAEKYGVDYIERPYKNPCPTTGIYTNCLDDDPYFYINGVMWFLQAEYDAAVKKQIEKYGHCEAFTTKLEGNKPKLFEERCLRAISLVKKNSLI